MSVEINSYLTFKLRNESFAINVAKVLEIKEYQQPRPLPQSLPFVAGVTEYNNEVIPVIDTGLKFGMEKVEVSLSTCIIILQLMNNALGTTYKIAILADAVSDVFESEDDQIKFISEDYRPEYVSGTFSDQDNFIYILNPDNIFNQKEVVHIMDIIKEIK
ncbi:MAG TPA: purine-binding chemotaxis protein CheW [Bacteroidales bacterium]|nr:purine-binding chemotaxis protein CheW [Bacteroidales bacterium]